MELQHEATGWNGSDILVCPACLGDLAVEGEGLVCVEGHRYVLAGRRPVLIDDDSVFEAEGVATNVGSYFDARAAESQRKASWRRRLPSMGHNRRAAAFEADAARVLEDLVASTERPRGLVLGSGERGRDRVASYPGIDWLLTDVDLHHDAEAVTDATRLALRDGSIDVVLVEHVLEHVIDPIRAAAEIERVLRVGGVVVAIIPFSFPWHGVPIDFFRVTPSGMRVLFRGCGLEHLSAGMGGGSALAYGGVTTVSGMASSARARRVAYVLSRIGLAPLRQLDRFEPTDGQAIGFAAEYQFVGRKLAEPLTNPELLADVRQRFA